MTRDEALIQALFESLHRAHQENRPTWIANRSADSGVFTGRFYKG